MFVQSAALRADLTQAVARIAHIARVTLADLLGSMGGNAREQQAFADLLRSNGTLSARVLETRADGVSVLELVGTRVALRLGTAHAPGELLQISLDDTQAPSTTSSGPAATVKLSAPATFISDLQNIVLNQIVTESIDSTSTIAASADAASPKALAHALQQALRSSGLFYESHLRGWVDGRVALESLFEEPQARVAEAPLQHSGETVDAARARLQPLVHPQLEPLVRQQLETLEQQRIVWHGCLWADQQAKIVIAGEPPTAAQAEAPRAWRVHLDLDSATLGPVTADIALRGRRLEVRLQGAGAAAQALQEGRAALSQALAAHDLDVNPIQVTSAAP